MIQPWSTGHDSIFDLGHTSPQLAQISPPMVPKPLAGLEGGHQTHQGQDTNNLATNFWDQQLDHPAQFGQQTEMSQLMEMNGGGMCSNGIDGSMEVEFEDMVHHNQCG
jgi:hypothetical protein